METSYSCQLTTSSGKIETYMAETDSEGEGCDEAERDEHPPPHAHGGLSPRLNQDEAGHNE